MSVVHLPYYVRVFHYISNLVYKKYVSFVYPSILHKLVLYV